MYTCNSAETFTLRNIFQQSISQRGSIFRRVNTQTKLAGFCWTRFLIVWFPCFCVRILWNSVESCIAKNQKTSAWNLRNFFCWFGGISHTFCLFSTFFLTTHSFIHPFAEGPLLFAHCSPLSEGLPGVPSRDSNSGLPYSKPSWRTSIRVKPHPNLSYAASNKLWRPTFIIALFVIVLWREFNWVLKIPRGEANKSANRWGNIRAKGGVVPPSVLLLPSSCAHQIYSSHGFAAYYFISTKLGKQ